VITRLQRRAHCTRLNITAENVFGRSTTEQKADFVKKLQAQGSAWRSSATASTMPPALEQADLGIAVSRRQRRRARGGGHHFAQVGNRSRAGSARSGAGDVCRRSIQNLFWAFFYNALGVPLAALGFISPILCAAAMGVSDLIVIGNALRLLRWRQSATRGQ